MVCNTKYIHHCCRNIYLSFLLLQKFIYKISASVALVSCSMVIKLYDSIHFSDSKRASVQIFLKASGFLECAIQHVLSRISPENRWVGLPSHLHLQKAYNFVVSTVVIVLNCHFV